MFISWYKVVFLSNLICICFGSVNITKYMKVCDRTSPDVNDCLVDAIQDGLAVACNGIEELGLEPVDPYHQDMIKVEYNNNQILVKMVMKDIYVRGMKDSKVHNVRLKADEDSFYLEIDMTGPHVYVKGAYEAEGRYNSLKISALGHFRVNMSELVYTWKVSGIPEKRDNETYIRIKSFYMRPDLSDLHSYLSNDNPETKQLTELGNNFANDNWRMLYRELLPYAQANWNKIGVRIANKIFLKVPYNQLFPAKS